MTYALPSSTPSTGRSIRLPSRQALGDAGRGLFGFVVILVAWEVLARTVLDGTNLLAPPSGIVRATIDNWGLYQRATRATLSEAAWGFLWGNLVSVGLASIVALAPATERIVLRVSLVVFCLPLVALGPLLRVVYGLGNGPQITLAGMAVFYTTLVPLLVGLRAVPQNWTDLIDTYGRGRLVALWVVRARASIPYLIAGLQVAAPAAFLGALVGEFTGADRGMGLLTINSMRGLRTDELWAVASVSALVSMAGYVVVGAIGKRLASERPSMILAATSSRRTGTARVLRVVIETLLTIGLVLGLWIGLMWFFDLNDYFAKRPADVWAHMISDPDAAANRAEVFGALSETAQIAIPGFLLGLFFGACAAAVFDLSPNTRRTVTPFAVALRCVPIVAIAPLLVQAFGRGVVGTTTSVAILTFFPTLVACAQGLRQTPGQVLDFYEVYDVGRVRTLLSAQVPAMLPAFFAAARIAVPATVLAATVAEWLATGTGIGNLMAVAAVNSQYDVLYACVVVVTVIAAAGYGVMAIVERQVLSRVAPEQLSW